MKASAALLAVGVLLATTLTSASAADPQFMRTYVGEAYAGFLEVRVEPPGGKGWTPYGRGSAQFTDMDDGRAKLVVFGTIDDEKGDAGFAVEGKVDRSGWSSRSDTVTLQVTAGGEIIGRGEIPPQRYRFSGAVTDQPFDLDVHLEITEETPHGLPAGTTFRFSYDLTRTVPAEEEDENAGTSGGGKAAKGRTCRKIRYEMRPVANIGDGSMSMIQVPICLK